jgi:uncharacterized membrane protein YdjX (TVP38/TMEM64 family)
MNARTAIAVLAAFLLIGLVALVLPVDAAQNLTHWLAQVQGSPWAVPAAIAAFVLLACIGAPQVVLITALVAAFGPWMGFVYSWIAKVISCAIGFWVGRRFGARLVERHASEAVARMLEQVGRRGFWASALIRVVPTVPSVMVNMAAGCTPMRFRDYIAGTALGSVPKMALTAFAGHAFLRGLQGGGAQAWLSLALAGVLMGAVALAGRWWLRRA